jgi:aminoglycoside phosphotransferase (APT) family kinase protein
MSVTYSAIKSASQPDAIAQRLAEQVIAPVLPSVQVKRVRTKHGRRFEAPRVLWNVYEAELELPGGITVHRLFWTKAFFDEKLCEQYQARIKRLPESQSGNPLDPRGYAHFFEDIHLFLFFFPSDPIFRRLGTVFDPDAMRPLLVPHYQRLFKAPVKALEAARVKYLPEVSCIVRYEADTGGDQPALIYGKEQHTRRGAMTFDVMRALWNLPARRSGDLVLAEPLAYHPEFDLLLQSALPGEEIDNDRHSEMFMGQVEAAAKAIATIHGSGIQVGSPHTVDVEIGRLTGRIDEFKMSSPRVYFALRDLITQIKAKADKIPAEAPVPSHGDYKYNQFLFDGERYGLIDVEYFVQAEPSFDLGKYCGHLVPATPKHWSDTVQADVARRVFLDTYSSMRRDYSGARFPIYEALSLATRALVATWSQTKGWEYMAETLVALGFERLKTPWGE